MTSPIYPLGLPVIKAPKTPQQIPLATGVYDQQNQHRIRRQIEVNFQDVYADIRRLEDDIAALGGSGGATTLAALTDTTISGTPTDRFLRHNGTAWVDAVIGVSDLPSHTHDWSQITSTPTTLAGYGITDAQPLDADLTAIAALSSADGNFIVGSPGGWVVESGATARTSLGLTIGTDVQAWDALLDDIAALGDPDADRILFWDDSAGALTWLTVGSGLQIVDTTLSASGSGGLTSAYANMTDGTTTAVASGGDTFKFRSANNAITVAVQDNDVTHGDNLLLTFNEANITITESQISDLGNYLTVPTLTQYGVVYAATTSTITSTAAPSAGSVPYSPDATSWNVTGGSAANQVLLSTGIGVVGWGTLTSAYTSGTFPPDSHTLDSHTGTLSVSNIAAGPDDSFLVTRASTVQWGSIGASDLPSHDLISTHTASGLTAGHVLRATGATTFAFQALQSSDLPSHTHDASDITTGTFAAARLGLSLAYQIPYTVDGSALSAIAAPATNDVLVAPTGVPAWGKVTSSMTTGTFPPDAHTFDSHTGTLSVSNIAAGPTDSFLVSRGSPTATVQWGSIAEGDLPAHDIISTHSATGLTAGHVLRATGATTFAFQALQSSDLPSHTHDASDITTGVLPVLRGGTGQSSWTTFGVVYSPDGTSLSDLGTPGNNNVLLSGGTGIPGWNKLTSTYTTGTFPPDSHSLDSHTGTLSVTNITAGADDTFLVTRASTVQWGTIQAADLPSHDLITAHSASGLTAGHVLRATGATTFAFGALQAGDLPSHTHDASDVTSGTFAAARLGLSLAYQIPYTIDGSALSAIAPPSGDQVLRSATGVPGWGAITSAYTTGTFPPDSHAYSSHTGTVPVADITAGADDTFLVTRSSTVQWGTLVAGDLPSHTHTASQITDFNSAVEAVLDTDQLIEAAWTFTENITIQKDTPLVVFAVGSNLFSYSEEADNSYWFKEGGGLITANSTTAPDGNTTADTLAEGTEGTQLRVGIQRSTSGLATSFVQHTMSVYAKANATNWITLHLQGTAPNGYTYFNLSTGQIGTVATNFTAGMVDVGNGWYRCWITWTFGGDASGWFYVSLAEANNDPTVPRNGTHSVYLWGMQLVQGGEPGVYTKTTTSGQTASPQAQIGKSNTDLVIENGASGNIYFSGLSGADLTGNLFVRKASTWEQIALQSWVTTNFAAASHTHDASDITTGTLAVDRGGTGLTSANLTAGDLIYSPDGSSYGGFGIGTVGQVLKVATGPLLSWGSVDWTEIANKPATFPPESHTLDSHTGTLSVTNITAGADDTFLVTRASTVQWGTIGASDLPSHDLITAHSASGLTAGHVLRATGATTFAFGAIQLSDLPTITVPGGGTGLTTITSGGLVYGNGTGNVNVTAAPGALGALVYGQDATSWNILPPNLTGGTDKYLQINGTTGALSWVVPTAGDADTLDGQDGTYYLARANHTGTQAVTTLSGAAPTALIRSNTAGTAWEVYNGGSTGQPLVVTTAATNPVWAAGNLDLQYTTGTLPLAQGGTGASLSDPGADRILYWNDLGSTVGWLTTTTGTRIQAGSIRVDWGASYLTTEMTAAPDGIDLLAISDAGVSMERVRVDYFFGYLDGLAQLSSATLTDSDYFLVSDADGTGNNKVRRISVGNVETYFGITTPTYTQYGLLYAATTSTSTSTAAPSSGSVGYSPDGTSWNVTGASAANQVLRATGAGLVSWGAITSAYTTGTFPPDSHTLDSHTGTLSLTKLTSGAAGTFLGMTGTTMEWQSIVWGDIGSTPTTLAGYGITDAQALDADLTAIAALGFTATAFLKKTAANTWALDTNTYSVTGHTHTASQITDFNTAVDNRLDTAQTISAAWTFASSFSMGTGTVITHNADSSRDKIRLYSGTPYSIGMQSAVTYGALNDWAMTFQFNNETDRGFWWGHDSHSTAQGAMSLTTGGILTVAESIAVGVGVSETTDAASADALYVEGTSRFTGQIYPNDFFNTNDNDAFSPDWNNGNSQRVTATSTTGTLAITVDTANMKAGAGYMLVIYNESGGNKAISVSGVDSWGSSAAPTSPMTNDRTTVMQFLAVENGAGTGLRVVGTTVLDNVVLPA